MWGLTAGVMGQVGTDCWSYGAGGAKLIRLMRSHESPTLGCWLLLEEANAHPHCFP